MSHEHSRREANQSSFAREDMLVPQAWIARSSLAAPDLSTAVRQIVFIDGAVPDAQLLAAGVKPGVVAVVLDPDANGVQQIADYLASHDVSNLAAIDIVAHGSDGALELGTAVLDAATIPTYAGDLATIGAALRPGGAVQLYGCDVAQDAAGVAFLQQLSDAAGGASIAAASHLVGAAAGGGSWTLNVDTGTVDAAAPFTAATLASYQGELAAPTGDLWLGSWDGLVDSTLNQLDNLSVSGSTVLGTTDVANSTQSNDGGLTEFDSLAIDPITGKAFILGLNGDESNATIAYVPTSGGAYTSIYSAPDTGTTSAQTGFIGEIRVDEESSSIYFTQSDFNSTSGAQYTADTGIFVIPETGGTPTQVVNDVSGGITLYNPTSMELDLPDNLAFFVDNDTYTGGTGTAELYVGSLTNHNYEALLALPLGATPDPNFLVTTALAIDTVDHILYFSTYQPAETGYSGFAGIYSVSYTPNGTLTTIGATHTLYTGTAAQVPDALAVDPATGLLYVAGTTYGNSGSSDVASAWAGPTTGGSLSEIFQIGSQTLGLYSYTSAAVFEAAPSLAASGSVNFAVGGGAVALDAGLTVTDESEPELASATVAITGFVSGDTLTVGTPGTLGHSFSDGTLTLTGAATLATYQAALASVSFSTTSTTPGSRTIDWTVNDGIISSTTPTSTVDVHTAPTVTAGASVTFTGGGAAAKLDSGLTVADASSTTLDSATVTIGGFISGDTLTVGTAGGLGHSFSNGTLTLTGSASLATYQTALDSISYSFSPADGDPTGGGGHTSRTIAWVVNDGVASSATADSTLDVVHAAPTIAAGGTVTFDGGGTPVTLDAGLSVSAPDSGGDLSSATVTIGGFISGDTLTVGTAGGLGTSFSNGTLTLTGSASLTTYQTALDSITYSFSPADGDPTGSGSHTSRTIAWVVNDGVASSATADSTLDAVHVAPTIAAGASVTFDAGGAPLTLDAGLSLSDPDSGGDLVSAGVTIGSGLLPGDTLNFTGQNGISGSYNPGDGVLTLSGTASIADYRAALESVTYSFSGDPTDGGTDTSRAISWSVFDGVDGSAPASSSLTTQCFCTGTRIGTPGGEVPVEALRPGDLVLLADGSAAPVRWIGRQTVARRFSDPLRHWPIRVRQGAVAEGVPRRDLLLSPGHALRVGRVLAHAAALVNGTSVVRERLVPETFVYWHVELDTHALLLAERMPAESFLDACDEFAFDNRASRPARAEETTELPYPRCKSSRQLPRDIRAALAARAALIGRAAIAA